VKPNRFNCFETHAAQVTQDHVPKAKRSQGNGKLNGAHAFRVGRSRTGLGVFATEPIKKGTYIVEYTGRCSPTSNATRSPDNRYCSR
jgi:hypothetical protein